MGLLDPTNDPGTMGLLSLGLGLLGSKGSFGNALSQAGPQALQAMQQVKDRQRLAEQDKQQQAMRALQMQQAQMQLAEAQRAQQAQQRRGGYLDSINSAMGPARDFEPAAALAAGLKPEEIETLGTKAKKPLIVGGNVLDPDTFRPLWSEPQKPEKDPEAIRVLKLIHGENTPAFAAALADYGRKMTTHQPGVNVSYGAPVAGVDGSGNPVFFQPAKGGGAPAIVPGVAPPKNDKPMTEAQAKAATFKSQMEAAERELSTVPLDMSKLWNQADVGAAGGWTNAVASPLAQRARQAQEQWSESFLRFKTGAAATADEVRLNVRTFFPQPWDGKDVIAQKKRMRDQAIQDIGVAASGNPPDHSAGTPKAEAAIDPLGLRGGKK